MSIVVARMNHRDRLTKGCFKVGLIEILKLPDVVQKCFGHTIDVYVFASVVEKTGERMYKKIQFPLITQITRMKINKKKSALSATSAGKIPLQVAISLISPQGREGREGPQRIYFPQIARIFTDELFVAFICVHV